MPGRHLAAARWLIVGLALVAALMFLSDVGAVWRNLIPPDASLEHEEEAPPPLEELSEAWRQRVNEVVDLLWQEFNNDAVITLLTGSSNTQNAGSREVLIQFIQGSIYFKQLALTTLKPWEVKRLHNLMALIAKANNHHGGILNGRT